MTAVLADAAAFCARDVKIWRSYRVAVLGQVVSSVLAVASFALLAPSVRDDAAGLDGATYLGFVAVGIAVVGLLVATAQSVAGGIREAQVEGTLESILSAPIPHRRAVVLLGLWPCVTSAAFSVVVLGLAGGFGDAGFDIAPVALAAMAVASICLFAGLSLLSAAFVLVARRGDPVSLVLGLAGGIAAGAYAPVESFPAWLRGVAELNPLTHALDGWRAALLDAASLADVSTSLWVVSASAAVVVPVGWWVLGRAFEVSRRHGLLAGY